MLIPEFEPTRHEYFLNGVRLPSVSEVLASMGLRQNWSFVDPFYAERGSSFHAAIALELFENLDHDSLDERIQGFVEQFVNWEPRPTLQPYFIETPLASRYGYAGTPDFYGLFQGEAWLLDWKAGMATPEHKLQLGAYRGLLLEAGLMEPTDFMGVVYFNGDPAAPPQLVPVEPENTELFYAAARLYAWKVHNNRLAA